MTEREIPLTGGRITEGVVRVGDTVRRPVKPGAVDLAQLLGHLQHQGFAGAPRHLGVDERGRAILNYLEGEVPTDLGHYDDSQLAAAARLLRRFHDATATSTPVTAAGAEVICHNDFGPPNAVFRGSMPWAMIDFDTAAPGARLWDLGYSAFSWLDLGDDTYTGVEQITRLEVFAMAYSHEQCTASQIAIYAVARQTSLAAHASRIGSTAMHDWASAAATWTATNVLGVLFPSRLPD